jgi:Rod binding domain-containing protein
VNEIPPAALAGLAFEWNAVSLSGATKDSPETIHAAASQFEALLLGQILRSMREAGGEGWLGSSEQDAAFNLMEMAEQCVAAALAAQGGFGLARILEASLSNSKGPPRVPKEQILQAQENTIGDA